MTVNRRWIKCETKNAKITNAAFVATAYEAAARDIVQKRRATRVEIKHMTVSMALLSENATGDEHKKVENYLEKFN